MILSDDIDLIKLKISGKEYPHKRPERCPTCKSRKIWGHGYVSRYFDVHGLVYLKRWICGDCGCVLTIRPIGYFSRHHRTILGILESITHRLKTGEWIRGPDLTRQRQGHWLRALRKNIKVFLGLEWTNKMIDGFSELVNLGQCPILRSKRPEATAQV
jgi:hypothetical protein